MKSQSSLSRYLWDLSRCPLLKAFIISEEPPCKTFHYVLQSVCLPVCPVYVIKASFALHEIN